MRSFPSFVLETLKSLKHVTLTIRKRYSYVNTDVIYVCMCMHVYFYIMYPLKWPVYV